MNTNAPAVRSIVAALLVAAIAACASVDPNAVREKKVDAASLGARTENVNWPSEAWWRRYGDPQLDTLIADGLAGSPTLAAARARVARADAAAGVAGAALLPSVNGNATSTYQRFSENYIFPPPFAGAWKTDNRLTLDFNWEIDFWNKNGAALDSALSQVQAAAADAQAARVTLTTQTARTYFDLQRLYSQRAVSLDAIAQRDNVVRLTTDRFNAGLDTRVEVKQAEAALGTVRTELAQYDEAINVAKIRLAALVGAGPERGNSIVARVAPQPPLGARPIAVPLDLVSRRPEIVASKWRVEASQHDVEVARAQFYPNVNIVAFLGLSSLGFSSLLNAGSSIVGVGPAIHLPIFEGGRLNANLRGRNADEDLAVTVYNQAVIDAVRDVADALAAIDGLARVSVEQAKARAATNDAYNLAVVRYQAGLGNYLTVLTAQTQQLVQDRLDADLKARAFELDVNLVRALGGGYVDDSPVKVSTAAAAR